MHRAVKRYKDDSTEPFTSASIATDKSNSYLENAKKESALDYLGCSPRHLRLHLESKFQANMSFENYGEWHIDHIRPCASFDLKNENERKECFHYSNLQPLWKEDNLKKGCKWTPPKILNETVNV